MLNSWTLVQGPGALELRLQEEGMFEKVGLLEGGAFYFGGFGERVHRMWGQELDCVWRRVTKAAVCPCGTLL